MEVLFVSEKLRLALSDHGALQKQWGSVGAKKINLRLQQLAAAPALSNLRKMPGHCHELTDTREGQLAVEVHKGFRLIFRPTVNPAPQKGDGGLDWTAVESVTVIEVLDYH